MGTPPVASADGTTTPDEVRTMARHYGTADLRRLLVQLAEPATAAARDEIGAGRSHRAYRGGLRTVATVRRAARQVRAGLRLDTAAALVFLAAVAGRVARQLRRAARRVGPVGPRFHPAPVAVAIPPAEVPDLTGGRSFRAVAWEGDGWTDAAPEPTTPVAAGPEPWGVVLPRSRRIVRPVAPPADVPADEPTPVVAVATPEPTPADEYAHAVDPAAVEPTDPPAAPVKPARKPRARKPAAPNVQTSAARATTPPAVPTLTSIDQARAALGSSDIKVYGAAMDYINAHVPTPPAPAPVAPPAVYLADVRPLTLPTLLKGAPGRFGVIPTVRTGWATDAKVLVRVPAAEQPAIVAQLVAAGHEDSGRPVPVASAIPTDIDPRPFTLTGRAWTDKREPLGVLTREDGAARVVDLRLYLTLVKHSPKGAAVYAQPTGPKEKNPNGRPLVCYVGDPTAYKPADAAGVLMPFESGPEKFEPWTDADEPLTLVHKAGSVSTRYALTRGEWNGFVDYLRAGRPALESLADAADNGATVPSGAARVKLAGLIDLAGGAPAVLALLGMTRPTAAAA